MPEITHVSAQKVTLMVNFHPIMHQTSDLLQHHETYDASLQSFFLVITAPTTPRSILITINYI